MGRKEEEEAVDDNGLETQRVVANGISAFANEEAARLH